jgi:hypothetical protein
MNKLLPALMFASVLSVPSASSFAAEQPPVAKPASSQMLVYINPNEYSHEILIRHPYYEYWFSQGPQVEALAKQKLGAEFGDVSMCEGYSSAKTVVWIKPSMFYNPIVKTYFGKIVAEVFAGNGKSLGTYTAKAERYGQIDINTAGQINATYTSAMNSIVKQMAASPSIRGALDNSAVGNDSSVPCANVALLSKSRSGASDLLESIIY